MAEEVKITLDTNCLIDLDEQREGYVAVKDLIDIASESAMQIAVLGISASEKRKDGQAPATFNDFKNRLSFLGLSHVQILKPIGFWGVTYRDNCIYCSEEMKCLHENIMDLLFANSPYRYNDPNGSKDYNAKHYNRLVDGQALWAHVWNKRDVFVTRDKNFHSKQSGLIELGVGAILTPEETIRTISNL
jgi:hypothetical protein